MITYITELNDDNYDEFIKEGVVLIDVWAEWCSPCKAIEPIINELSVEYNGKIKVGKCNIDSGMDKIIGLGIKNIPTVILYKNGEIVDISVGLLPKSSFNELIDKHI